MTLQLPHDIEEMLNRQARRQQTTPELFAVDLLREKLGSEVKQPAGEKLSLEERAEKIARLRAWINKHDNLPELAPEAFSREYIYSDHD